VYALLAGFEQLEARLAQGRVLIHIVHKLQTVPFHG
jgi:hypothetical protein